MSIPLSVLIVEDMDSDVQLLVRYLRKAGYELVYQQVDTAERMRAALEENPWDIVISDYKMPQFDGLSALKIFQETGIDIPFIVVSGTIGDETAVAMMKAGAHDYLIKGALTRLVPAVERELEQASIRRERKKTQERLNLNEQRFQVLIQNSADLIVVIDREGTITYASPSAERISGYTAEDALGRNFVEWIHPEDRPLALESLVHRREVPGTAETVLEIRSRHKDGIWRVLEVIGTNLLMEPSVQGIVLNMRDITQRKIAEEALRESKDRYRTLVESSPDSIGIHYEGKVVYVNTATVKLLHANSPEDLIGMPVIQFVHPDYRAIVMERIRQSYENQKPGSLLEEKFITLDGQSIDVEVTTNPITYEGKAASQIIIRDITERKKVEVALRETEARNRALLDAIPDMMFVQDKDGVYIDYHAPKEQLLIAPPEIFLGKNMRDILPPQIAEEFGSVMGEASRTGRNQLHEYSIDTPNGQNHFEAHVISYQTGNFLSIVRDITGRRQAEAAMRTSEERYRELFNSMIDGFALHEIICDENGTPIDYRFLEINPAYERLTGLQSINVIGRTATEVLPNIESYWIEIYGNVALTGRSTFFENYSQDLGRYYEVSAYCPRPGQFAAIIVDITERKQAEQNIHQRITELQILYESGLAISQLLEPKEIWQKILDLLEEKLAWHHSTIRLYNPHDKSLELLAVNEMGRDIENEKSGIEEHLNKLITRSGEGLSGWAIEQSQTLRIGNVQNDPHYVETYPGIYSGLYVPMKLGERKIGVISIESEQPDAFSESDERLLTTLANQAASAFENARMFDVTRKRLSELEMLYESGLEFSQLLTPGKIGQKVLELLEDKLGWHHTRIRLYHPRDDSLELLDFNRPGLINKAERHTTIKQYQNLITRSDQGLSGLAVQQKEPIRKGDVRNDPRYIEAYPGICSGLYVPMKLGERVIGVISIEDEKRNAFSHADERLIATLANQAASAFENARLFAEARQRVLELETVNRISLALRAINNQNEMLSIVLDEALAIINTSHGGIELYNKAADNLFRVVSRGWFSHLTTPPQKVGEGIIGKVFTTGEMYITREFSSDSETRAASRSQIPTGWGGACLPIRTTQQTLGVLIVSVPSERELSKDETRLLSILSEMTGAALQRMQLHEQTVRRLDQLNALRTIDQSISSSRDMRLTLNILLDQTQNQLGIDAADVLLLHAGSSHLELIASRGLRTHMFNDIHLNNSFAGHAIMENRPVVAATLETPALHEMPKTQKFWKDEGIICYWCVPLIIKGDIKGALEVYRRSEFTPDPEWLEFLEALAGQAAITIDNSQLFSNLQRANTDLSLAYDATIEGWSRALDLRDHDTEGHTLRVTDLTLKLALAMRVSESHLTAIRRGALLHDIGKMAIPDAILLKEGKLTDEEWEIMRKHPQYAIDMLISIAYLHDALEIPHYHHEKWDGTGYPLKLKGYNIPLSARIFAIADVWDAITNDRPYRQAWDNERALNYIREQSGTHFDPQIVEKFLELYKNS